LDLKVIDYDFFCKRLLKKQLRMNLLIKKMKKNSIYIKLKITFIKIIKDFSAKNVLKKIYKIADDFHLIYIFKRMFVFFVIN